MRDDCDMCKENCPLFLNNFKLCNLKYHPVQVQRHIFFSVSVKLLFFFIAQINFNNSIKQRPYSAKNNCPKAKEIDRLLETQI